MTKIRNVSPFSLLLTFATLLLIVLIVRGLNIPALHTDIFILRGWFRQFGAEAFADYYFQINQRHPLVGPIYAVVYSIFGEQDFYYNLFFQAGRLLNGVLLGGVVMQLFRHRTLALCAGLALMLTPIRLPESFQQLSWLIELSLSILLLSLYCYLISERLRREAPQHQRQRLLWYTMSFVLCVVSILIYEAGIPWLMVFFVAGWMLREDQAPPQRVLYLLRDLLPFVLCALAMILAIFFVWKVWDVIAPDQGVGSNMLRQFIQLAGTLFQFPQLYLQRFISIGADGYYRWTVIFALVGAVLVGAAAWFMRPADATSTDAPTSASPYPASQPLTWRILAQSLMLGITMLIASILVSSTASDPTPTYLDRTSFARDVGITLVYVTLIFALFHLLLSRSSLLMQVRAWKPVLAAAAVGAILVGPGLVWLLAYQTYAHQTAGETERMAQALTEMRWRMTSPVHLVIITPRTWAGSRFSDATDLINDRVQQLIWDRSLAATVDILQTSAPPEEYAVVPGTCDFTGPEGAAGTCIDTQTVYHSRWAQPLGPTSPVENLVLLRYDDMQGTLTIVPEIALDALTGYNIVTAGLDVIKSNPERLVQTAWLTTR